MPRKKKTIIVEETPDEEGSKWSDVLGSDAKRSIIAVFLFSFAVIFFLAFFDAAGVFGSGVSTGLGLAFGWGKWLFPLFLVAAGVMFLRKRDTALEDAVKFVGLATVFVALLSLVHLFAGSGDLLKLAQHGGGGGYLGFSLAYTFGHFMGTAAAAVVLGMILVIGIIAAFNVSLAHFIERLSERWKGLVVDTMNQSNADGAVAVQEETTGSDGNRQIVVDTENIHNIRFADDETTALSNVDRLDFLDKQEAEPFMAGVTTDVAASRRRSRRSAIHWELPSLELLDPTSDKGVGGDIEQRKHIIQSTLKYFGIEVEPGEAKVGPAVTQYAFRPAVGVKLSKITTLSNDLALALAAHPIRIEAPIPGQSLVGIEVPNKKTATVHIKEVLLSREFKSAASDITLVLGKDVSGNYIVGDLNKMPHLLIAGRTGSGKSVCINAILLSLLYQCSPEELQLILVDPKRVELSLYNKIPHLKTEVIVDHHKVVNALKWAIAEMTDRYKLLQETGSRDIASYHKKFSEGAKRTFTDADGRVKEESLKRLPYIVIVIDEMADLMAAHGKEVEALIIRLAQMSRAVGIHLILATQRPSVEVITGLIKANIPTRVAFQVQSQIDSRTILDTGGAEKLLGNGDMLYAPANSSSILRLQGVFVTEDEVKKVTEFLREQKKEKGWDEIGEDFGSSEKGVNINGLVGDEDNDPLYEEIRHMVIDSKRASTTSIQTAFGIGYPRAARIMHLLEKNGIIGVDEKGKKRVLVDAAPEGKQYGDDPMNDQAARDKWQM